MFANLGRALTRHYLPSEADQYGISLEGKVRKQLFSLWLLGSQSVEQNNLWYIKTICAKKPDFAVARYASSLGETLALGMPLPLRWSGAAAM